MQYLLLIYRNDAEYGKMGAAAEGNERGIWRVHPGHRSERPFQGRRRLAADDDRDHRTGSRRQDLTTDGPFAETREQLGGYYLVEAKDLDTRSVLPRAFPGPRSVRSRSAGHGL